MLLVAKFLNIAVNDFHAKVPARCSLVLVVNELIVSGTQCNIYHLIERKSWFVYGMEGMREK